MSQEYWNHFSLLNCSICSFFMLSQPNIYTNVYFHKNISLCIKFLKLARLGSVLKGFNHDLQRTMHLPAWRDFCWSLTSDLSALNVKTVIWLHHKFIYIYMYHIQSEMHYFSYIAPPCIYIYILYIYIYIYIGCIISHIFFHHICIVRISVLHVCIIGLI